MMEESFWERLVSGYPWPMKGDRLFSPPMDPMDAALIERHPLSRLTLMTEGYKRAGDLLVQKAAAYPGERDLLVYPAVFCYRHYFELAMKGLLVLYGPKVDVKPDWSSHKVEILWDKLKALLYQYEAVRDRNAEEAVEDCLKELAQVDQGSYNFRYSVTRAGDEIRFEFESLDLAALSEKVAAIHGYFSGTDGMLYDLMMAGP